MNENLLIQEAFKVFEKAYAPYSKFHVGASILLKDGTIIRGANIENASYGLTICAERSALVAAYSQGYRANDIVAMAVVSDCQPAASPCGACRQVIHELMPAKTKIYIANKHGLQFITSPDELLPFAFSKDQLHDL